MSLILLFFVCFSYICVWCYNTFEDDVTDGIIKWKELNINYKTL